MCTVEMIALGALCSSFGNPQEFGGSLQKPSFPYSHGFSVNPAEKLETEHIVVSGKPKPEEGGNMLNKEYARYLEEGLYEEYKFLFENGDMKIPGIRVFKVTVEKDNTILIHAIETREIGQNVELEERYIDALLTLEELGAIELLDRCNVVEMYEIHDLSPHKVLLALWSYKLLQR